MRETGRSGDDAEDVVLANEGVLLVVELNLGATVFADEHAIADLHFERRDFTVFALLASAEGNDLGLLGLFFGAVRDDDASADLLFFFDVLDEHAIADGLDFDVSHIGWVWVEGCV